jgi:uncharacterized membrane protein
LGIVLAVVVGTLDRSPDPASWAVTVDRARDSLMGMLAIMFAGLSIVLALTAVIAQNVATRFSLRLHRILQEGWRTRFVIAVFAGTTTFIMTEQFRLRSLPGDDLAPEGGLALAMLLLLFTGATIIWYMVATMRSLRIDATLRYMSDLIRSAVRNAEHHHRLDSPVPAAALRPPPNAVPIHAPGSGYVVDVDTDRLHELAAQFDVAFGFDSLIGAPVVQGNDVGWVASLSNGSVPPPNVVGATIEIARSRNAADDVAYGIRILVDMAIMALSTAVNDPYTAVEVVNELTLILVALAGHPLGPRGRIGTDGRFEVAVAGRTLSDYLDLATEQILLYGVNDPGVAEALTRLARTVETSAETEPDRRHARALAGRIPAPSPIR